MTMIQPQLVPFTTPAPALDSAGRQAGVEMLNAPEDLVDRLEELVDGSLAVSMLDLIGLTRYLVAAPRFLSRGCAPRNGYRQITRVRRKDDLHDLVRLVRRSAEAERGTYFCARHSPLFSSLTSFCVIERADGLHVVQIHALGRGKPTRVVVVHDDAFGQFMLQELDRLQAKLGRDTPALFADGLLDAVQEKSLFQPPPAESALPRAA